MYTPVYTNKVHTSVYTVYKQCIYVYVYVSIYSPSAYVYLRFLVMSDFKWKSELWKNVHKGTDNFP